MTATVTTQQTDAIVAVLDLSRFTTFCAQADPSTDIPAFLNGFLEWLFGRIERREATPGTSSAEPLWEEPPFFAKFLGDGIMLLWDAGNMVDRQVTSLLAVLLDICNLYRAEFLQRVGTTVKNPPQNLRCRVARGSVFSVNNGRDYVGHCINIAVRLHEFKLLSFAVLAEGFTLDRSAGASLASKLLSISLPVRGMAGNQPTWVLRTEVESLRSGTPSK